MPEPTKAEEGISVQSISLELDGDEAMLILHAISLAVGRELVGHIDDDDEQLTLIKRLGIGNKILNLLGNDFSLLDLSEPDLSSATGKVVLMIEEWGAHFTGIPEKQRN